MFFHNKKNAPVSCPVSVIFEIIRQDLELNICCSIDFIYKNRKHQTGVWGDDGETRKNVSFYLDKNEFPTLAELEQCTALDGIPFFSLPEPVTVTECDGCYPRSTPLLDQYYREQPSD